LFFVKSTRPGLDGQLQGICKLPLEDAGQALDVRPGIAAGTSWESNVEIMVAIV
jgi:hypothetical protein